MIKNAVVIGASSGGPPVLEKILSALPTDLKSVVVVMQHLPAHFTQTMTERFARQLQLPVSQPNSGDILEAGHIYIVPGDSHFFLSQNRQVTLIKSTLRLTPSIDMGFTSVAEHFGPHTLGVVLTGMGEDGLIGARAIKQLGGRVIVQNEETSAVFGMPKAIEIAGFADKVLSPEEIVAEIVKFSQSEL